MGREDRSERLEGWRGSPDDDALDVVERDDLDKPLRVSKGIEVEPRHFVRVDVERPHMRSVEEGLNADGRIPKDRARYEAIHIQLKHVERT